MRDQGTEQMLDALRGLHYVLAPLADEQSFPALPGDEYEPEPGALSQEAFGYLASTAYPEARRCLETIEAVELDTMEEHHCRAESAAWVAYAALTGVKETDVEGEADAAYHVAKVVAGAYNALLAATRNGDQSPEEDDG